MKSILIATILALTIISTETFAQGRIYRSGGGEIILSGADVRFNNTQVNNNMRFTLFFHTQQMVNFDLTNFLGLYTGLAIRNVGLITEDLYQNVGFSGIDNTHPNWNKSTKIKRRSYSLGFPLAVKLGAIKKQYFLYAGGEYEWMFHYKQKLFIDNNKTEYKEWGSDRVNPWIPSVFAGVQFPGGLNLKVKYYLDDFLNTDFVGRDFGEDVDYSQFESTGIWYISLSMILNSKQLKKMMENPGFDKSAYRH
jgi:hypothetical protein